MVDAPLNSNALGRLQGALDYWQEAGYEFVNLPWLVSRPVIEYTRPPQAQGEDIYTPHGGFVASGEQSFIQLWLDGKLKGDTRYVGWTPCIRQEPVFDARHHFYFIKAELFVPCISQEPEEVRHRIVRLAKRYFIYEAGTASVKQIDDDQFDIEVAGIEVCSYGLRTLPTGEPYVYGTALAEPRLSYAIEEKERAVATKRAARTANESEVGLSTDYAQLLTVT